MDKETQVILIEGLGCLNSQLKDQAKSDDLENIEVLEKIIKINKIKQKISKAKFDN